MRTLLRLYVASPVLPSCRAMKGVKISPVRRPNNCPKVRIPALSAMVRPRWVPLREPAAGCVVAGGDAATDMSLSCGMVRCPVERTNQTKQHPEILSPNTHRADLKHDGKLAGK